MNNRLESERAPICIWMSAGVLNYKLCDRDFDCEQCPLDAALRGESKRSSVRSAGGTDSLRRAAMTFPPDRLYSEGHTWIRPVEDRPTCFRFGLDSFATSMMTSPRSVRWNTARRALRRGDMICGLEFDDGRVHLAAPMDSRLARRNDVLADDPDTVRAAPYGNGWLVELEATEPSEPDDLMAADAAEELARLDLRRLRRHIALQLLADAGRVGATLADGGELIVDPWRILSGARYLELLRELIH
jgi:glycine cleavage system H protein